MNEVGVVATIGENAVPPPDRNYTRDGHGQHNKEILIRKSGGEGIDLVLVPQPLQESGVLLKQKNRVETAGQGKERKNQTHAHIEFAFARFAAPKDPVDEKTH